MLLEGTKGRGTKGTEGTPVVTHRYYLILLSSSEAGVSCILIFLPPA